ncbi:MAG: ABC transporter ATP-binding protein [Parvibaculales bacterium]
MTSPIILVDNLNISLPSLAGEVNILKSINLSIQSGEVVAITGPSGCGKTTLLMALAGLEPPSTGAITIAGMAYQGQGEDALARFRRNHIGIVFQSFHLMPTMTALENVTLPLELANDKNARLEKAEAALDEVGLLHRKSHYPSQLSGGEQQRVALARAMISNPAVLLADEPTGNLDQKSGQQIMDLIFRLREKKGTTLVLVTHDQKLAARCDRMIRLQDGCLMQDDSVGAKPSNSETA